MIYSIFNASNVVKIEQCIPYMVYKNKAFTFAISALAFYLYELQHTDRYKKHPEC